MVMKMNSNLELKIKWSKKKVRENEKAHIIFQITNNVGKVIALTGYKMNNRKDNDSSKLSAMNWNERDPHFNIILWHRDKHEFHWSDVPVTEYYNLNEKGLWNTFVQIRFIIQGFSDMEVSNIVDTTIEII